MEEKGNESLNGVAVYNAPIRVVIIDDHDLMRKVISDVLSVDSDIRVVGSAGSPEEALALIETWMPDVVIIDFAMPNMNGIEVVQQMRARSIERPVVMVSVYNHQPLIKRARQAGVQAYLEKQKMVNRLALAVHEVSEGQTVFE